MESDIKGSDHVHTTVTEGPVVPERTQIYRAIANDLPHLRRRQNGVHLQDERRQTRHVRRRLARPVLSCDQLRRVVHRRPDEAARRGNVQRRRVVAEAGDLIQVGHVIGTFLRAIAEKVALRAERERVVGWKVSAGEVVVVRRSHRNDVGAARGGVHPVAPPVVARAGHDHDPGRHGVVRRHRHRDRVARAAVVRPVPEAEVDDVRTSARQTCRRTVVNPGDDVRSQTLTVFVHHLDGDQRGLRRDTLEGLVPASTLEVHLQTIAAHGDARHVRSVTVVIRGIGIVIDEVVTSGGVDPVGVHDVVRTDAGITNADTHAEARGRDTGKIELLLQTVDHRRAVENIGVDGFIDLNPQDIRRVFQVFDASFRQAAHADDTGEDGVLAVNVSVERCGQGLDGRAFRARRHVNQNVHASHVIRARDRWRDPRPDQ